MRHPTAQLCASSRSGRCNSKASSFLERLNAPWSGSPLCLTCSVAWEGRRALRVCRGGSVMSGMGQAILVVRFARPTASTASRRAASDRPPNQGRMAGNHRRSGDRERKPRPSRRGRAGKALNSVAGPGVTTGPEAPSSDIMRGASVFRRNGKLNELRAKARRSARPSQPRPKRRRG